MIDESFYFILFFSIHDVRCGKGMIRSVDVVLMVWSKKGGVEHGVDTPFLRKIKFVYQWGDDSFNGVGTVAFWCYFL